MEWLSAGERGGQRYVPIGNEDRGRHSALSRRSVRRVPLLPRILRRGREDLHVEKKHIDFVLFFAS